MLCVQGLAVFESFPRIVTHLPLLLALDVLLEPRRTLLRPVHHRRCGRVHSGPRFVRIRLVTGDHLPGGLHRFEDRRVVRERSRALVDRHHELVVLTIDQLRVLLRIHRQRLSVVVGDGLLVGVEEPGQRRGEHGVELLVRVPHLTHQGVHPLGPVVLRRLLATA